MGQGLVTTGYANTIISICNRYGVADLYAFGSRSAEIASLMQGVSSAAAKHHDSDVDIGVQPCNLSQFEPLQRISLVIELEDLFDVPRVDLVVLPEADPFLALEVIRGELLYTDDPDRQARHELYILRRAGDLLPFKKLRIRMILEDAAR